MNKIEQEVKEILVDSIDKLAIDRIELTDTLEGLGADSLASVEIIMSLEEKYKIKISEDVFADIHTVQDIIEYITKETKS
jgi:acyl carrier protein